MADNELILNFDPLQNALSPHKPSFRGGRWRDRLLAKKSAQRRQAKTIAFAQKSQTKNIASSFGETILDDTKGVNDLRTAKRQRVEGPTSFNSQRKITNNSEIKTDNSIKRSAASVKPENFISSLFTSNPAPVSKREANEETGKEDELIKASNAPLESELYNFTSLGISKELASHLLTKLNIKAPTAVQEATIPHLLQNDTDTFIKAETGSGKTLAYLLPIVQRIMALRETAHESSKAGELGRQSGLFAIFLAPTRELCKQISVVLESVLRCSHLIVPGAISGGEKKKSEKARLRKGINLLVATPGRLMDHLQHTEVLNTSLVRWLVLDEGDRLMDLGFEEQIQRIIGQLNISQSVRNSTEHVAQALPNRRVTILCSATLKTNVQKLGELSLKGAKHIQAQGLAIDKNSIDERNNINDYSIPAQLRQSYALVPAKLRLVTLNALLKHSFSRRGSVMKAIVFVSCADSVDFHFSVFTQMGADILDYEKDETKNEEEKASSKGLSDDGKIALATTISSETNKVRMYKLHGSLPQHVRKATLASFSANAEPVILICTDVASRGLDVPNVDLVLEYDPPFCKDDHFHRIGRTARAGQDGRAMIFLQPGSEEGYIDILKKCQRETSRNLIRHDADDILRKGFLTNNKSTERLWGVQATDWQVKVERWALQNEKYLEQARRAYQSHVRAYATHVADERDIFNIKDLHLGHLAKAFALRDKPKNIRVPGLRPGQENSKVAKSERKTKAHVGASHVAQSTNLQKITSSAQTDATGEAAHKMRAKLKEHISDAAEFNIG